MIWLLETLKANEMVTCLQNKPTTMKKFKIITYLVQDIRSKITKPACRNDTLKDHNARIIQKTMDSMNRIRVKELLTTISRLRSYR